MARKQLSKIATALLTFLSDAIPVYGAVNFQATPEADRGKAPQTLGEGSQERYVWVHQSYAPRKLEGMNVRLPSLMAAFLSQNPGSDYIAAIQELVAANVVQQRAVKGGYVVALQSDIAELPERTTAAKAVAQSTSLKDAARFLKARR